MFELTVVNVLQMKGDLRSEIHIQDSSSGTKILGVKFGN